MFNVKKLLVTGALAMTTLSVSSLQNARAAEPSWSTPTLMTAGTFHGNITAFDGKYALRVRDDDGNVQTLELHQGTVINPLGLTLRPGMDVVVRLSHDSDGKVMADQIDVRGVPPPEPPQIIISY